MNERVELHSATDRWMMGDRYGTVVAERLAKRGPLAGHTVYRVKLDVSGKVIRVTDVLIGRWL
jgi:hypothetical protein